MTKSVFNQGNLLPYVNEEYDQIASSAQQAPIFTPAPKRNGLALTAIILTGVAFFGAILVVPTVISTGFSIAALVIAIKRGTSKVLSLIALIASVVLFIGGSIFAGFLFASYDEEEVPIVPSNYTLDYYTGLAYKTTPVGQIPCDANGLCVLTIDLIATDDSCTSGGELTQELLSQTTSYPVTPVTVAIPPLDTDGTATVTLEFVSSANDVLMVNDVPEITCV